MSNISAKVNEAVKYVGTWKFWKELIIMTLGMMVTAAAVYYFLVPSKLIIGTISGLSIVLSNIFTGGHGLGTWIMCINIVLLIMAFLLIDSEFGFKTVYTALILGPLTDFWDAVFPWQNIANDNLVTGTPSVMGDPWLDLCCFVLLLSASQALMFSINASTGGLDILAKIVNKFLHFDIGASVSIAGAVICCTAFFINDFRSASSAPGSTASWSTTSPPPSTTTSASASSPRSTSASASTSSTSSTAAAPSTRSPAATAARRASNSRCSSPRTSSARSWPG